MLSSSLLCTYLKDVQKKQVEEPAGVIAINKIHWSGRKMEGNEMAHLSLKLTVN